MTRRRGWHAVWSRTWPRLWPLASLMLAGCGEPAVAEAWVTTADQRRLLEPLTVVEEASSGRSAPATMVSDDVAVIMLDTAATFQTMIGFGAALTDASVEVIDAMRSEERRRALLTDLFSPTDGIGLSVVRFTIGASDFSSTHYTLDDSPQNAPDTSFAHFSVAVEQRAKLPLLRRVRSINPSLTIMATPWSAPAWMKTPTSLYGGTLRADAMPWYADYLLRALAAYAADSVPVDLLSVQNEPAHARVDYPGMTLSSTQRAHLVGRHLGPRLAPLRDDSAGAMTSRTRIVEWDHNWDAPDAPLAMLADTVARRYVHGVAWHCYAGDVAAQSVVHDRHPDVATYFTECSGGEWAPNWGDNLLWNTRTLLIGATRHWARGVLLWNVALDRAHGPHLGGCNDCRGVVTVHAGTDSVTRNVEYYALAHASRFVTPGSVRIGSQGGAPLEHVAFRDAATRDIVVLLANPDTVSHRTAIRGARSPMQLTVPARSIVTVRQSAPGTLGLRERTSESVRSAPGNDERSAAPSIKDTVHEAVQEKVHDA